MDHAIGAALAPIPQSKKVARVALVDIRDAATTILADCFRQFGIESVVVPASAATRLQKEKFEACVVGLGPNAAAVMEAARSSSSNSRIVIYGLGGDTREALRYSKYGVNAMFHEPVERTMALKLVRATQMLVLHEFRRYVRIPVVTEVAVQTAAGKKFSATSVDISSGGMSLRTNQDIGADNAVEVSFALLTLPRLWIRGSVTWRRPNHSFGVRFDQTDDRRRRLKDWIDAYLES